MSGIPVTIHLTLPTFNALERIATAKGVGMRTLIEAHLERSLQKRDHTNHRSRSKPRPGKKRPYVTLDEEQQQELVQLTRLGWSLAELADRYGCSTSTIDNWRKRLGVQRRRKEDM